MLRGRGVAPAASSPFAFPGDLVTFTCTRKLPRALGALPDPSKGICPTRLTLGSPPVGLNLFPLHIIPHGVW